MKTKFKMLAASVLMATLTVGSTASAPPKLTVPFEASATLQATLDTEVSWMELYRVPTEDLAGALSLLKSNDSTPPTIGLFAHDYLHVDVRSKEVVLKERSFDVTRNGSAIEYTSDCTVRPLAGDRLVATYSSESRRETAMLSVTVIEQFAYQQVETFNDQTELRRLDLAEPEACSLVTESRLLFNGTLSYAQGKERGAPEPVLVQAIYLK